MQRLKLMAGLVLAVSLLAGGGLADTLVVVGTVADDQQAGIEGAVVTVTLGTGPEARMEFDTTDANGDYEIVTVYGGGGGSVGILTIVGAADGYVDATELVPVSWDVRDDVPDTVTQDLELIEGQQQSGDSLYVSGLVEDDASDPVEGATVTVTILSMSGTQTAEAATASDGTYEIAMVNESGSRDILVEADADGYMSDQSNATIADPADGTPDEITRNFVLNPIVLDTTYVVGEILDYDGDAQLEGAQVVVSYIAGGVDGETVSDTATTLVDGSFSLEVVSEFALQSIAFSVELAGYASESGNQGVVNDTADIGTIRLVAYTTSDTVDYQVTGVVSDENGDEMQGVELVVTISAGSELIAEDTVMTNRWGRYTVNGRAEYQDGDITVTVTGTVDNYEAIDENVTVASSTSDIVVDITLVPETSVIGIAARRVATGAAGRVSVYSISGRLLDVIENGRLDEATLSSVSKTFGVQPLIMRLQDGSSMRTGMVVPAH